MVAWGAGPSIGHPGALTPRGRGPIFTITSSAMPTVTSMNGESTQASESHQGVEAGDPRREPVSIGIDVGSTTVKAVVVDPVTRRILWSDYQRHQTKQAEKVLE